MHQHYCVCNNWMAFGVKRGSIWNDNLDPGFLWVVDFFLFWARQSAIAIVITNAKQIYTNSGTIPQNEVSWFMEFVGVLIAIVELYDSSVTNKPELVSWVVPKSSILREELWFDDRPLICISGIVLEIYKILSWN